MADPTNPPTPATPSVTPFVPTPEQNQLLSQYTELVQANVTAQADLDTTLNNVSDVMDLISRRLDKASISMDNLTSLTDRQLQQFTLLTTGIVKTREAFEGLSGINFEGLSTFTEQFNDLKEALASGGTAASDLGDMMMVLSKRMSDAGIPQSAITAAYKKGAAAVIDLSQGIIKHADNLLRTQSAYVQMTAATGDLADTWNAAGDSLQNMNDVLSKQTEMIADSIGATGLAAKQVEAYWAQLGQIPGALNATVAISEKGGEQTSMLTAAIETATGTGRKYADVMTDLKTAFRDYGIVGEDALRFSVRMSNVSTNLKAPIEDVTTALRGSADAFKMFATGQENASRSAESLAKTLNQYGKALESTGLSATAAVEVASQLSNQVAKLSTGQLAFISQQTGGPGGLRGAAAETLKLQTDPGAVVRDAMRTLQQQFGRIVTLQEAATSEAAASQNVKQTLLLQQLLGPLAKDQATANRLLEAMKNEAAGQPDAIAEELKPTAVQDATQKGIKLQEGSYSELTKIRSHLARMQYLADQGAGRAVQSALTARGATTGTAQGETRTNLSRFMTENMARGGTQVQATAEALRTGSVADTRGREAATALHSALGTLKDLPTSLRSIGETIQGAFQSSDQVTIKQKEDELKSDIKMREEFAKQLKGNSMAQIQAFSEISTEKRLLTGAEYLSSATAAAAAPEETTGGPQPTTAPGAPGAPLNPNTLHIIGKITIDCPHCGKPHDASNQFALYTGPAGQTSQ